MNKIFPFISLTIFLSFLFQACDHGLKPDGIDANQRSGISGYIQYQNWPPADSLKDLRLVIFKKFPPQDILGEVISGNAIVYPGLNESNLPYFVDTTIFSVDLDPGTYEYVVVAMQYGANISTDWLAVGQYDTVMADPFPTTISVRPGTILKEINIDVDFHNLPIQPF